MAAMKDKPDSTLMAFVGPLPPPIGGVAVMNKNIQSLFVQKFNIDYFNTSRGRKREELYGRKGLSDLYVQLGIIVNGILFLYRTEAKIVNIFVTSNLSFLRDLLFIIVAFICRKKIVTHLHSKKKGEFFLRKYLINVFGLFLSISDKVVVLSEVHEEHFVNFIRGDKLEVLENFVFAEHYKPHMERKICEFLYVGRLTKEKGIFDLIKAVVNIKTQAPNIKIHVMGLAETQEAEYKILKLIESVGVKDNILFYGALSGHEKYNLFHRCSVFVFPSYFENSPVVLKEALAASQLIVCSDIDANKTVLGDNSTHGVFYYPVGDDKNLGSRLLEIYNNSDGLENALQNVRCPEDYTSEGAYSVLVKIYQELGMNCRYES